MINTIFLLIDEFAFKAILAMIITLIVIGLSPLNINKADKASEIALINTRKFLFGSVFWLSIFALAFSYFALSETKLSLKEYIIYKLEYSQYYLFVLFLAVIITKFIFIRYGLVMWSNLKKALRYKIKTDEITTIDSAMSRHKDVHLYDFEKYVDIKKGCFVGLNEQNNPIYIDWEDMKEYNKEILGATRRGKGVVTSMILYQKIIKGWTCFFIDPKQDKFIPRVMKKACDKAGKELLIIDLVEGEKYKYAPFRGSTLANIKDRVKSVYKLRRTGQSSDYYKGIEINLTDDALEKTDKGIEKLYSYLKAHKPVDPRNPDAETGIESIFRSLNKREQIKPKLGTTPKKSIDERLVYPSTPNNRHVGGISIARAILENKVIYIRGHTKNMEVRDLTKLILEEIIQEVERLSHIKEHHVSIDIDESRFLMSETLSNTLAVILGFGCDVTLQYQSIEDIRTSVEKDLDMKSLAESVHQNTQVKIIHGGLSSGTAEYGSEKTGTITKSVEFSERTTSQTLNSEGWDGDRTIKTHEENLITMNDFLGMSKMKYALLMPSTKAQVLHSSFVDVESYPLYQYMEK